MKTVTKADTIEADNDLNLPTGQRHQKEFQAILAWGAMAGVAVYRTDPQDGPVQYITDHRRQVQLHRNLDKLLSFLGHFAGGHYGPPKESA